MTAAIRVLVVDDQQLLRRGLVMLFGTVDDIDVVAQAAHGAEALAVLRTGRIDVVLADAKMPVMDGIELVRQCARAHPDLPVLVLTTFDEPDVVQGAVAAGAAGFLLKDTSIESPGRGRPRCGAGWAGHRPARGQTRPRRTAERQD